MVVHGLRRTYFNRFLKIISKTKRWCTSKIVSTSETRVYRCVYFFSNTILLLSFYGLVAVGKTSHDIRYSLESKHIPLHY